MDLETYEDTVLPSEVIGEDDYFLVEGNTYDILLLMTKQSVWNYLLPLKPL